MTSTLIHDMVPTHEKVSKVELKKIVSKYNISKEQLPNILLTDPALSGLDVKSGDVIMVTRENSVTGTSLAYRIVVSL